MEDKADLVVKNGRVCIGTELIDCGIAIKSGKIVAIASEEHLPTSDNVINANRMLVIPGFIDAHVHTRDPGYTWKEDFETATRCAAFGGVTTIVDMPNVNPAPLSVETFISKKKICESKAIVDFNHWASPLKQEEIPGIVNEGAVGFKIFMKKAAAYPYDTGASTDNIGLIYKALRVIANYDVPCIIHPYNEAIYQVKLEEFKHSNNRSLKAYCKMIYSPEIQVSILPTLIYLAKRTKARIGILHADTEELFKLIKAARDDGQIVYQELNPYSLWPIQRTSIAYEHLSTLPSGLAEVLEEEANKFVEQAWRIMLSDDFLNFGYIASDHAPHLKEEFIGVPPEEAHLGWGDLLSFYLLLFLNAVNEGVVSIQRVVKLCSENPAKLLGLYPKKGAIHVGSDADLVVVDMRKEYTISAEISNSKCGWSIWDGMKVRGAPRYVILRGEVIAEEGRITGRPGLGKFVRPITKPFPSFLTVAT